MESFMARTATTSTRAPRGTKIVADAFFAACDDIPEPQRANVTKAALTMIRDRMKDSRDKAKVAKDKQKATAKKSTPPSKVEPPAKKKAPAKAANRTSKKAAPKRKMPAMTPATEKAA